MAADLSRIMDKVIDFNKYALALYTTIAGAVLALFLTYSAFEDSDTLVGVSG